MTTMQPTVHAPAARARRGALVLVAAMAALLAAACDDDDPVAPDARAEAVATLRRVTERYHDVNAALADGFVFLHGCEVRPGEGQVGAVYVHPERLADATIDLAAPEALIYEPRRGAPPALVGVELVIPFTAWTAQRPPEFLGAAFQREDEFGVYGLHLWVWRDNPRGLFALAHPGVSC